jgi:DNA topoisomerase-1
MSKKLFIVESPNKCGKIRKYLGADYDVKASVGHIRSIPRKGLNIDIKNGFIPFFEISKDKKDVVKAIKDAAKKCDEIILATDPDREGEGIAYHIHEILDKASQKKCKRVTFDEITKTAILKALDNKRDIDYDLVDAQKARQVLDRLIGYKISPTLWKSVQNKTSAGRVQSIALKIVCEKENDIKKFKKEDFWHIDTQLGKEEENQFFSRVVTVNKDNRYLDGEQAEEDFKKIKKSKFKVDSVIKKERKVKPQPPFDTSSLQTTCSSYFGWSAKKTASLAQSLYESSLISYIRTDSFAISEDALKSVRNLIKKMDSNYLPKTAQKYAKKSKASSQEAHECIRPTDILNKGEEITNLDEEKLYKLIRDRFIACQMKPMIVDTVTCNIKTDTKLNLISKGQTIKFDGWQKVYKYSKTKEELLPELEKGDILNLYDAKKTKHETQPPPRYNEGSLIKKMEGEGVGRPSTYPSIMEAIIKKGYVEHSKGKKGALQPTELGFKIFEYLDKHFNENFFMDIKFTASIEDNLDKIANGEKTYLELVQSVYDIMSKEIKKAGNDTESHFVSTDEPCAVCKKGLIVEKNGKFGKFYTCDQYPKCKTIFYKNEDGKFITKKPSQKAKSTGIKCPECKKAGRNGELLERKNKKQNTSFLGCNQYPKCKHTQKVQDSIMDDVDD